MINADEIIKNKKELQLKKIITKIEYQVNDLLKELETNPFKPNTPIIINIEGELLVETLSELENNLENLGFDVQYVQRKSSDRYSRIYLSYTKKREV